MAGKYSRSLLVVILCFSIAVLLLTYLSAREYVSQKQFTAGLFILVGAVVASVIYQLLRYEYR
ncbi:MAG TPA: hypothetical protein VEI54_11800 [Candidatus Limnocylindrales bacterium]|nr:hypothetical protein [Candidatus Limnocylindrales bacterium]